MDLLYCYPTLSGQGLRHLMFQFIDFSRKRDGKGKLDFQKAALRYKPVSKKSVLEIVVCLVLHLHHYICALLIIYANYVPI